MIPLPVWSVETRKTETGGRVLALQHGAHPELVLSFDVAVAMARGMLTQVDVAMKDIAAEQWGRPAPDIDDEMRTAPTRCPACDAELTAWVWRGEMGVGYEPAPVPVLRLVTDPAPGQEDGT